MTFNVSGIDHIALVPHDPAASARLTQEVLGARLLWETSGGGGVLDLGGTLLVFESPRFPPAERFLATRGEGIHHVGINVTNLDDGLRNAEAAGARLLNPSLEPGGVRREVLVHPKTGAGVLWQVIEWAPSIADNRERRRAALRNGEFRVPGIS